MFRCEFPRRNFRTIGNGFGYWYDSRKRQVDDNSDGCWRHPSGDCEFECDGRTAAACSYVYSEFSHRADPGDIRSTGYFNLGVTGFNNWTSQVQFALPAANIGNGVRACITNGGGCASSYPVSPGGALSVRLTATGPVNQGWYCASVFASATQAPASTISLPQAYLCVQIQTSVAPTFQISTVTSVTVPATGSVSVQLNTYGQAYAGGVSLTSNNTSGGLLFGTSASGALSSTPSTATISFSAGTRTAGVYTDTITATGTNGVVQSQNVTVTIRRPGTPVLSIYRQIIDENTGGNNDVMSIPNDGKRYVFGACQQE